MVVRSRGQPGRKRILWGSFVLWHFDSKALWETNGNGLVDPPRSRHDYAWQCAFHKTTSSMQIVNENDHVWWMLSRWLSQAEFFCSTHECCFFREMSSWIRESWQSEMKFINLSWMIFNFFGLVFFLLLQIKKLNEKFDIFLMFIIVWTFNSTI